MAKRDPVLVDLGLQGGGAHGAFTWGVLDRLLDEPWLRFDGISGTSAGAMNAAVMAGGLSEGGSERARIDALGDTYRRLAAELSIDPALLHRVAVIGAGTLDSLPHNGAVVTLLAVCGSTHRECYLDIVMAAIVGPILALLTVIILGSVFGSF